MKTTVKPTILCVDDEIDNIDALERIFRTKYQVLKATSGAEALAVLAKHLEPIALIITDQRMPQMTGVEFLTESMRTHPDSIRILLTGYTDMESIISAVNSGQIYRYINKPWDTMDLMNTAAKAVERFAIKNELKEKNIALEKALNELQTLDQAKNQFMILINHELKTPLTTIMSFSELLKESKLDDEQTLSVDRITKSADRLKELVDDVLMIVSAETNLLKPKKLPFDINLILNNLNKKLTNFFEKKNLSLKNKTVDQKIIADQVLIQQVLERILHNAGKFSSEDSEINLEMQLSQPHRMIVKIFNKGPKISEARIDKILKPFYLDEDVMNHSVGTGLGLTLCQSILKSHSSQLQIENKNSGVEVSFELPCL